MEQQQRRHLHEFRSHRLRPHRLQPQPRRPHRLRPPWKQRNPNQITRTCCWRFATQQDRSTLRIVRAEYRAPAGRAPSLATSWPSLQPAVGACDAVRQPGRQLPAGDRRGTASCPRTARPSPRASRARFTHRPTHRGGDHPRKSGTGATRAIALTMKALSTGIRTSKSEIVKPRRGGFAVRNARGNDE